MHRFDIYFHISRKHRCSVRSIQIASHLGGGEKSQILYSFHNLPSSSYLRLHCPATQLRYVRLRLQPSRPIGRDTDASPPPHSLTVIDSYFKSVGTHILPIVYEALSKHKRVRGVGALPKLTIPTFLISSAVGYIPHLRNDDGNNCNKASSENQF